MLRAAGPSSVEAGKQCLGVFTRGLTGTLTAVLSQSVQGVGGEGPPQLGRDSLGRPSLPMAHRSPVRGAGPQPLPPAPPSPQPLPRGSAPRLGLWCFLSDRPLASTHPHGSSPAAAHQPGEAQHILPPSCLLAFLPLPLWLTQRPPACHSPWDTPYASNSCQCAQNALPSAPAIVPQPSLLPQMQRHHR